MFKLLNDIQLSKNFKISEFECPDGSREVMLEMRLVDMLQKLRDRLGVPLTIESGYRNPTHNIAVRGSPNSRHMLGQAADVKCRTFNPKQVAAAALLCGFTGIGTYLHNGDYFNHLDIRPVRSLWHDIKGSDNLVVVTTIDEIRG
jgi:uncharacterized protein YcbK (DUF882 family)